MGTRTDFYVPGGANFGGDVYVSRLGVNTSPGAYELEVFGTLYADSIEGTVTETALSGSYGFVTGLGTVTFSGKLSTAASTTSRAGLNLPSGTAPTSPVSGDLWNTSGTLSFRSGTSTKTVAFTDSAMTGNTTGTAGGLSSTLAVSSGGTGQTSYTNGQLLIGNTTGNTLTKATLTGTANQVTVTNGAGSITLSLPQDIATTSTPTFSRVTLSSRLSLSSVNLSSSSSTGDVWRFGADLYFNNGTSVVALTQDLPLSGGTMTGRINLVASNSFAPLNFGSASLGGIFATPGTGDVWRTNDVMYFRKSTGTVNFVLSDDTTFLSLSGGTMTGKLGLVASNGFAALNFGSASLSSGLQVTGDAWRQNDILYFRKSTGQTSFVFNDDGSGLQALNGSNITSGTVPAARLPFKYGKNTVALNSSGVGTIDHGLGATPTFAHVGFAQSGSDASPTDPAAYVIISSVSSSTITFTAYEQDTTTIASANIDLYWFVI